MNKRLPAALLGSLLLAACLPKPAVLTMDQIRRMDYGSYPRNYEQLIKRHLAQTLIDPNSVMYGGFSRPRKFVRFERRLRLSETDIPIRIIPVLVVFGRANPETDTGGYTGWKRLP